ncbi:MAG: hypothetical protein HKO66_09115, partial [Saprospiraceae bacterium]|nr:hypothetical protein [Saprospiraceae bacterium]
MSTKSFQFSLVSTMKYYLGLLIGIVIILGCSKTDIVETDVELQPYFDIFASEGEKRGFIVDYEAERIEGLLQDILSSSVQGQCFRNESKPKKVIIDTEYWANATDLEREFIIYHELGHCFLNRDHLDSSDNKGNCVSIMHSNPGACNFILTPDNRDA